MLWLLAFLLGTLIGLLLKRQLRPLFFERWSGLPILLPLLLSCLLPTALDYFRPDILWTDDRRLLLTLLALPVMLALALIVLNILPVAMRVANRPPRRWYHRAALLVAAIGIIADAAVRLLNNGYMPISESYLTEISDPIIVEAICNQALRLKQLIGPDTTLPWLGQIWHLGLFKGIGLSVFPYISPGQVVTAIGLFLTGLANFFGDRDTTGS